MPLIYLSNANTISYPKVNLIGHMTYTNNFLSNYIIFNSPSIASKIIWSSGYGTESYDFS